MKKSFTQSFRKISLVQLMCVHKPLAHRDMLTYMGYRGRRCNPPWSLNYGMKLKLELVIALDKKTG